eukprot:COSAG02_NODE_27545_length_607_cov_0.891732_1_plen_23_part_10
MVTSKHLRPKMRKMEISGEHVKW